MSVPTIMQDVSLQLVVTTAHVILAISLILTIIVVKISSQGMFKLPCSMEDLLLLSLTVQCVIPLL